MFHDPVKTARNSLALNSHYTKMPSGIAVRNVIADMNNIPVASVKSLLTKINKPHTALTKRNFISVPLRRRVFTLRHKEEKVTFVWTGRVVAVTNSPFENKLQVCKNKNQVEKIHTLKVINGLLKLGD